MQFYSVKNHKSHCDTVVKYVLALISSGHKFTTNEVFEAAERLAKKEEELRRNVV